MRREDGFTVLEVMVVLMVVGIIVLALTPRMNAFLITGKVEPTAKEINAAAAKMRVLFARGGSTALYDTIDNAAFALAARPIAVALKVDGDGAATTIRHLVGAPTAFVTVAPSCTAGVCSAFSVTIADVNQEACFMGNQFIRTAYQIQLNSTVIKASEAAAFDASGAQTACLPGDSNNLVVTFR